MSHSRRDFLLQAGVAASAFAAEPLASAQDPKGTVSLALDPADPVASAVPVQWAAGELQQALEGAGVKVRRLERLPPAAPGGSCAVRP